MQERLIAPPGQPGPGPRAGVIGLGTIGSGVVSSLARSGVRAVGFDIDPEAVAALPCAPAGSAAELAAAVDVVLVCVVDAAQVEDVLFGDRGVVSGAAAGLVVAVLSTVSTDALLALGARAGRAGLRLVDCPVTGGQHAATNGLVAMLGGDEATVEEAMPVVRAFTRAAIHCGPLGAGMATKLVRQLVVAGSWKVMYDAARFAQAVGVDYARVKEVTQAADPDGSTILGLMAIRGDTLDDLPESRQEQMRRFYQLFVKDITAAHDLAGAHGFDLPMVEELLTDPGPGMYGLTIGRDHG